MVYCLPHIAFSGPCGLDIWTGTSFSDERNGGLDVHRHECSPEHREAKISMHQCRGGNTVRRMTAGVRNAGELVEDNRKVFECFVD